MNAGLNRFNWLIRRELWETRSVWLAPAALGALIVACILVPALVTGSVSLEGVSPDQAADLHERMTAQNLDGAASLALGLIGAFFIILLMFMQYMYALDALYGERRDRSVLFWKSLPVSDAETVLSKLGFATLVMPAVTAAATIVTAVLSAKFGEVEQLQGHLWTPSLWGGSVLVTLYILLANSIWYLPVLGWCLLVSAWVPRSPLMYSILPPAAIALIELIALRSSHVWHAVLARIDQGAPADRAPRGRHAAGRVRRLAGGLAGRDRRRGAGGRRDLGTS
jgi:ABC-2 type transport system permease protein